jgi:hypothetical protein
MKRFLAAMAFAALIPFGAAAQNDADLQRADLVATCLVNAAGVEEEALFHNLLLAIVNRDEATARTFVTAVESRTREIAIAQCNQPDTWQNEVWAGAAIGSFLQRMLAAEFNDGFTWLYDLLVGP